MLGELITLPVRVGVGATRLWFRALEETVSVTSNVTGRVIGALASRSSGGPSRGPDGADRSSNGAGGGTGAGPDAPADLVAPEREAPPARSETAPETKPQPPRSEPAALRSEPGSLRREPAAEPQHVSEEPELVEEFAEPGAEQGAGAEIHIDPPWDEYEKMSAKQVISRLASADPAALAAVQLYESSHRRRQTILNAAERELRNANGSGSRANHS